MQNYTNSVSQCKKCFRLCVLHSSSFLFCCCKGVMFFSDCVFRSWIRFNILFEIWCVKISSLFKNLRVSKGKRCRRRKNVMHLYSQYSFQSKKSYKRYVQKPSVNQNNDILCHGIVFFSKRYQSRTSQQCCYGISGGVVACKRLSSFIELRSLIYARNFTEYRNAKIYLP